MATKTITVLACDRCKRELRNDNLAEARLASTWSFLATQDKQILLCPDDTNAFKKFMRGAGVKAVLV